jgi:hypothetical protein
MSCTLPIKMIQGALSNRGRNVMVKYLTLAMLFCVASSLNAVKIVNTTNERIYVYYANEKHWVVSDGQMTIEGLDSFSAETKGKIFREIKCNNKSVITFFDTVDFKESEIWK